MAQPQLPPEVTRMIFEYADDEELAKLCMLNKDFNQRVCNSNFWLSKIIDRFGLSPEEIQRFRGNNTLWAYYKHLSELDLNYRPRTMAMERLYHHPDFIEATRNIFNYRKNPIWLNQPLFETEARYKLADLIIDAEYDRKDNKETIEQYYGPGIYFRTSDIGSYEFIVSDDITIPNSLYEYVQTLL